MTRNDVMCKRRIVERTNWGAEMDSQNFTHALRRPLTFTTGAPWTSSGVSAVVHTNSLDIIEVTLSLNK